MENDITFAGRRQIGGIKLSEELNMFACRHGSQQRFGLALACIATQQINITYLCHGANEAVMTTTLCVPSAQGAAALACLEQVCGTENVLRREAAGAITLFPHNRSITLLSTIIRIFRRNALPLHGFCTSISALTLLTDYDRLDDIVALLLQILKLPDNHAPLRQEFCIRQISS